MVKYLFIVFFSFASFSQETFVKPGLVRAIATISPSLGLAEGPNNIYLNGELEVFFNSQNSIRGDVFALVGTEESWKNLKHNHYLMTGPSWHLARNRWDLFAGFETGIVYTSYVNVFANTYHRDQISGVYSGVVGAQFYVHDYFHFFVSTRYIHNLYRGYMTGTKNLSELTLSAGLGFQIQTKKN